VPGHPSSQILGFYNKTEIQLIGEPESRVVDGKTVGLEIVDALSSAPPTPISLFGVILEAVETVAHSAVTEFYTSNVDFETPANMKTEGDIRKLRVDFSTSNTLTPVSKIEQYKL